MPIQYDGCPELQIAPREGGREGVREEGMEEEIEGRRKEERMGGRGKETEGE